jgi:hypothetical protein
MKFIVLVKASAASEAGAMPSEKLMTDMGNFNEEMVKAGILLSADGLHPSSKATRIRFDGAQRTVVDGPFGEPEQLVAGFWVIEVASHEEAVAWMRRAPAVQEDGSGEIEIRRIFGPEDFGDAFTPELREQEERMRKQVEQR